MLIQLVCFNNDKTSEEVIVEKNTNPFELTPRISFTMPVNTSLLTKQSKIRLIIHHIGKTMNAGHYTTNSL